MNKIKRLDIESWNTLKIATLSNIKELLDSAEILLEHNSKPRNFRKLDQASQSAEGYNPLCGDQITVYLDVADAQS